MEWLTEPLMQIKSMLQVYRRYVITITCRHILNRSVFYFLSIKSINGLKRFVIFSDIAWYSEKVRPWPKTESTMSAVKIKYFWFSKYGSTILLYGLWLVRKVLIFGNIRNCS